MAWFTKSCDVCIDPKVYYQKAECDGYWAKITVEWHSPVEDTFRMEQAEKIADDIVKFAGPQMRDMVNKMRGEVTTSASS
jgi:hypothetical protein